MLSKIPIKLHCWGGLGSQLYAWALCERLANRFPKRRILLILHTDGITRRDSELDNLFSSSELMHVNDFVDSESNSFSKEFLEQDRFYSLIISKFRAQILKVCKDLLLRIGILSTCNTVGKIEILRPWLLEIRGHYSQIEITDEVISSMLLRAQRNHSIFINKCDKRDLRVGVHFRLGDLMQIVEKSPIDTLRLANCISGLSEKSISIFSDSPKIAISELKKTLGTLELEENNMEIWQTLSCLISSEIFVGTPSKISEWVVAFRMFNKSNIGEIFLPKEMKNQMETILPKSRHNGMISYY